MTSGMTPWGMSLRFCLVSRRSHLNGKLKRASGSWDVQNNILIDNLDCHIYNHVITTTIHASDFSFVPVGALVWLIPDILELVSKLAEWRTATTIADESSASSRHHSAPASTKPGDATANLADLLDLSQPAQPKPTLYLGLEAASSSRFHSARRGSRSQALSMVYVHTYIYIWLLTYKSPTFTFCEPCFSSRLAQKKAKTIWPEFSQYFVSFSFSGSQSPFTPSWGATTHLRSAYFPNFEHIFEKSA